MVGGTDRVTLVGSERRIDPSHHRVGDPDPHQQATVTLYLRTSSTPEIAGPAERHLTREEYAAAYGATDQDVAAIGNFAADHGLTVGDVNRAGGSVELRGTLAALSGAFGAELGVYE